jgi:hypothetical protein
MVMTVRDEARFLAANLIYHHALGVGRAYIFLDRCTDASGRIAGSFPWVVPFQIDRAGAARIDYVTDLHRAAMDHALELARREGIDWLLTVDADEFAFGAGLDNPPSPSGSLLRRGGLRRLLARVSAATEMVRLRPKEIVAADLGDDAPFWKQRYFQDYRPAGPALTREILDPLRGEVRQWQGLLGHPEGKSIVRTAAPVQSYGSHSWVRYQGRSSCRCPDWIPLQTEDLGFHYHFVVISLRHWQEKFRKLAHEPGKWPTGDPVSFPKQCWKDAATVMSGPERRNYYARWVAVPPDRLRELLREKVIAEEDTVEQVLRSSGALRAGKLCIPRTPRPRPMEQWSLPDDFWQPDPTAETRE